MSLNILKEIEAVYKDYQHYADMQNKSSSDSEWADWGCKIEERGEILDRLIKMASIFAALRVEEPCSHTGCKAIFDSPMSNNAKIGEACIRQCYIGKETNESI